MIIRYDESSAPRAALAIVAELLPGAQALAVTAWKPILSVSLSQDAAAARRTPHD